MDKILILVGSASDIKKLEDLERQLTGYGVAYDIEVASCHRDLDKLYRLLGEIKDNKYRAIIAIANSVSNMPAIVAGYLKDSRTVVIGVGLDDKGMNGIDSLLSINTIPKGVPLANTGVGQVGLHNAGMFVAKLFASS
jgi:5-(carboxyamino)imidazole ribonucleotide mutase